MTLTPKARFLANKDAARIFGDIAASEPFQRAAEVALAEMLMRKPAAKDAQESPALGYALEGAREYLSILMSIAEAAPKLPDRPVTNLKHTV